MSFLEKKKLLPIDGNKNMCEREHVIVGETLRQRRSWCARVRGGGGPSVRLVDSVGSLSSGAKDVI